MGKQKAEAVEAVLAVQTTVQAEVTKQPEKLHVCGHPAQKLREGISWIEYQCPWCADNWTEDRYAKPKEGV